MLLDRSLVRPPKLFIVLPIYNEAANLPVLFSNLEMILQRLERSGHEHVYVSVDDGSTDKTPQLLSDYQQTLPMVGITHATNQGLGPTLRDGLRYACHKARDDDIIISMDADSTHPAGLMIRMTEMILEGNDVVIASRYQRCARVVGLKWFRRLMSFGARVLFKTLSPIPGVRDYTCGYRAYRARVMKAAFELYGDVLIEEQGFQCMAEILLKISANGAIIREVPMILRYDLKRSDSKMRVGTTVWNTILMLLKRKLM